MRANIFQAGDKAEYKQEMKARHLRAAIEVMGVAHKEAKKAWKGLMPGKTEFLEAPLEFQEILKPWWI